MFGGKNKQTSYMYSSSEYPFSWKDLLPNKYQNIFVAIISLAIIFLGNQDFIAKLLNISDQNKQDFGGFIGIGVSKFLDFLQNIPLSDTLVVFVLNFFIAYIVISTIWFGVSQYKHLKNDVSDINQQENYQLKTKGQVKKSILIYILKKLTVSFIILAWATIYFVLIIPVSINVAGLYLKNIGSLSNIPYLLISFLIIFIGSWISSIYLNYFLKNKFRLN